MHPLLQQRKVIKRVFFFLAAPQFFQCSFYLLLYDYIGDCKSPLEAKFSVQNKKQSRLNKPAGVEHDLSQAFCAITEEKRPWAELWCCRRRPSSIIITVHLTHKRRSKKQSKEESTRDKEPRREQKQENRRGKVMVNVSVAVSLRPTAA